MTQQEATNQLFKAAEAGDVSAVRAALDAGADPTAKDDHWQETPLHFAASGGHTDAARLLIENGADVNARDGENSTPLHCCIEGFLPNAPKTIGNNHANIVRLLIEKGADLNARDDDGSTPVNLASDYGHTDLVKMLQDAAKKQPGHAGRVLKRRGSSEPQIGGWSP